MVDDPRLRVVIINTAFYFALVALSALIGHLLFF
jgi:hypothetical protein